jgi:hypothetical protein
MRMFFHWLNGLTVSRSSMTLGQHKSEIILFPWASIECFSYSHCDSSYGMQNGAKVFVKLHFDKV